VSGSARTTVVTDGVAVPAARVELFGVEGIGEVTEGDQLAGLVADALAAAGERLRTGDVVVVSSKVVSKAEGRAVAAPSREACVDAETVRIVAERATGRGLTRVVQARSGPVLAAAGVDASNVEPGTVLLLPADPDASARSLRAALTAVSGAQVGVIISDTAGRAWRDGQTDLAIGAAGVRVTDDLRGGADVYGNALEVTVRALADELAAAADLIKGKLRQVPVAVVRGLGSLVTAGDGPGASSLLRGPRQDWFALGHVEAVRTALGAPPGTPGVDPAPLIADGVLARLRRTVAVARAGTDPFGAPRCRIEVRPGHPDNASDPAGPAGSSGPAGSGEMDGSGETAVALVRPPAGTDPVTALLALGATVQRIAVAAWAEELTTRAERCPDGTALITARPLS
jgi:coenzyme F420-0:L-glutamate ligase/coenzyme F420-1:gamma-L-glutamate ligase